MPACQGCTPSCRVRPHRRGVRLDFGLEQRRLRTVEECRARQFRSSCDELRGKDVAIEIELNKRSWDDALAYKQEKRKELDRDAAAFAQTWEADRISKMKREEEEAARRAKWNSSTKDILDQQVQEKAKIEQFRREQESVAARKDIERWQREIA